MSGKVPTYSQSLPTHIQCSRDNAYWRSRDAFCSPNGKTPHPAPDLSPPALLLSSLLAGSDVGRSTLMRMRSTLSSKRWHTNAAIAIEPFHSICRSSSSISKENALALRPAADRIPRLTLQGQELPRRSPHAS